MVFVAVAAPWIAPYPEQGRGASDLQSRFEAPSADHPFGTDNQGRDVLSRLLRAPDTPRHIGGRRDGGPAHRTALGGLAGYYGGWADEAIMRVTDIFLAFPALVLAMAMVAILGPNLRNLALAIVVTWWPWYTRLVRGMAVSLRQRPYVEAAKTMGVRDPRIVLRHILPNSLRPAAGPHHPRHRLPSILAEVAGTDLSWAWAPSRPPPSGASWCPRASNTCSKPGG